MRARREQRAADIEDLIQMGLTAGALALSTRQDGTVRLDNGKPLLEATSQEVLAVVLGVPMGTITALRRAQLTSAWAEAAVDDLLDPYPESWAHAVSRRKAKPTSARPDHMPRGWVRLADHLTKIARLQQQIRELSAQLQQGGTP